MPYAILSDRSLIALSGEDTLSFLQGLVSNDVSRLHERGITYTALLTPQGKFLHDFFIMPYDDKILLDCEKSRAQELLQRLMKYRLRSKVAMEVMPDSWCVAALWEEAVEHIPPTNNALLLRDPRLPELGWRIIGENGSVAAWCQAQGFTQTPVDDYDVHRLTLGVPQGGSDLIPEKSFLLPYGFEDLHGVDFTKGCYVGQEVTARSKHRGQIRKCIYKVTCHEGNLPTSGTPVYANGTIIGELASAHNTIGLALLNREDVEKHLDLRCGDHVIEARIPAWLKNI